MREVYKNDVLTSGHYTGERRLGTDLFTGAQLADENEVLSTQLVCDRCGCPPRYKHELVKTSAGFWIHPACLDDGER